LLKNSFLILKGGIVFQQIYKTMKIFFLNFSFLFIFSSLNFAIAGENEIRSVGFDRLDCKQDLLKYYEKNLKKVKKKSTWCTYMVGS